MAKSTKIKFLLFQQGYHIVNFMHRSTICPHLFCYDIDTQSKWMEADYLGAESDSELIICLRRTEDSIKGLGKFRVGGKNSDTILRIIDPALNSDWSIVGLQGGKYGPKIFVARIPRTIRNQKARAARAIYCPLTKDRKKPRK